jgi:hypothetical protein
MAPSGTKRTFHHANWCPLSGDEQTACASQALKPPEDLLTEMCGPQTTTADSIQGTAMAQLQQN